MGNCLVLQPTPSSDHDSVITIMRMDGKILTYLTPIKVYQILEGFPGHIISDPLSVPQHLNPTAEMLPGRQYYMLPVETPMDDQIQGSVVRVKLVVTKKELREMLRKEATLEELVLGLQGSERRKEVCDEDEERLCGWRPSLESIPEGC